MSHTPLPPVGCEYGEDDGRYLEQYGNAVVTNRYLRIAVLCQTVLCLVLGGLLGHAHMQMTHVRPLILRIDGMGRAEPLPADALTYTPRAPELRYFLVQFITTHYGRMRAVVREHYARSLYFLDTPLADAAIDADRRLKTIETFLTQTSEEIDIVVTNVALDDPRTPPYKATVYFQKVYASYPSRQERRREQYVAHLTFDVRDHVPNEQIPINPLGLRITYLHLDKAFQ